MVTVIKLLPMRLRVSEWTEKYMTKPETDSLAADGPLSRTDSSLLRAHSVTLSRKEKKINI